MSRRVLFALFAATVACQGTLVEPPLPESDGGAALDLGPVDLGGPPPDAGPTDATSAPDAAPLDASPPDAAAPDAGSMDAAPPDTGAPAAFDFVSRDGRVVFEAEHHHRESNNARIETYWERFEAGQPDPTLTCVTDTPCTRANRPACNEHANCDGDRRDPSDASGGVYLEALPDRRRTDDEANTGELGVVNNTANSPTLHYRVRFDEAGRFYVWCRAYGQGPAANGLHVGLDGRWPRNDLIDAGPMRLQFPNRWQWTQNRRGGRQHTGVGASGEVTRRDANVWLEIDTVGIHTIELGMREDGLELDKCLLTKDPRFEPDGFGPPETRP